MAGTCPKGRCISYAGAGAYQLSGIVREYKRAVWVQTYKGLCSVNFYRHMAKKNKRVVRDISKCPDWVTDSCEGSFTYLWKRDVTHEIWVDDVKLKPTSILEYNSGGWIGGHRSFYLGDYKKESNTIVIKTTTTEKEDGNVIWEEEETVFYKKK